MARIICEICGREGPENTPELEAHLELIKQAMRRVASEIGFDWGDLVCCPDCQEKPDEIEAVVDAKHRRKN